MSDGKILTGGGKERKVMEWNQFLQKTGQEVEVLTLKKYSFSHLCDFLTLLEYHHSEPPSFR